MDKLIGSLDSTDALIVREILKICSSFKFRGRGIVNILIALFGGSSRILIVLLFQFYIKSPKGILNVLRNMLRALFYRTIKFRMDLPSKELYVGTRLRRLIGEDGLTNNGFPVYFDMENEYGVLKMIRGVHSTLYSEQIALAQQDMDKKSTKKTIYFSEGCSSEPKYLFASRNYRALHQLISNHFEAYTYNKQFPTLGILIDGEPGLGKSDSLDFLARTDVYGEVYKIDMTANLDKPFEDIVSRITKKNVSHTLIVMVDELDKYLDVRMRKTYQEYKDTKSSEKKFVMKRKEYVKIEKEKFLYQLLNILETRRFTHGVVFLFCSNNFELIFSGVDAAHFKSLKDRFLKVTFSRCDCEEFKEYVRYLNTRYKGTKWYHDDLEVLLSTVRLDLSIPFRKLCHINISSCYDIKLLIKHTNLWENESIDESDEKSINESESNDEEANEIEGEREAINEIKEDENNDEEANEIEGEREAINEIKEDEDIFDDDECEEEYEEVEVCYVPPNDAITITSEEAIQNNEKKECIAIMAKFLADYGKIESSNREDRILMLTKLMDILYQPKFQTFMSRYDTIRNVILERIDHFKTDIQNGEQTPRSMVFLNLLDTTKQMIMELG